jgi:hypothetical protein
MGEERDKKKKTKSQELKWKKKKTEKKKEEKKKGIGKEFTCASVCTLYEPSRFRCGSTMVTTFLPFAAMSLIILVGFGNKLESQVKYRFPLVCSMSSQMTSYGKLCSSNLASTARTSVEEAEEAEEADEDRRGVRKKKKRTEKKSKKKRTKKKGKKKENLSYK